MLKHSRTAAALAALALTVASLMAADAAREKQLQQGKDLLEHGDLLKAATLFVEVARSADPEVAARGLFHLAYTQELQGRTAEARATYGRLLRDFPRQRDIVERTQARVTAIDDPTRATQPTLRTVATGDDASPDGFLSKDGRYLSRPDWNTGDIAIRDLTTGRTQRLLGKVDWSSPPGFAEEAMLSPDNSTVVYGWYPDTANAFYELRLIDNRPGARPSTLLAQRGEGDFDLVGWAPDGRSVLVVIYGSESEANLARVSLATRSVTTLKSLGRRLAERGRLSLSPDGKYVAYALLASPRERNPQGRWVARSPDQHLYVLPTDGSGREERIVGGSNVNEAPVWTPDGKRLLFVSNRDNAFGLWSVAVENGTRRGNETYVDALTAGRILPIGMSSSGAFLYLSDSDARAGAPGLDVLIADVDAATGVVRGTPLRLAETNVDSNQAPSWSPDGTRIAFLRRRSDLDGTTQGGTAPHTEVVVHSLADGTEQRHLDTYVASQAFWSRDGKSLFFKRNYNNGQLWRWEIGADEPRSVESIAHSMLPVGWDRAALAPDDRTIFLTVVEQLPAAAGSTPIRRAKIVAFDLRDGAQRTVWTSADAICPSAVTKEVCSRLQPAMAASPDGKALALMLWRNDWPAPRLMRLDIATGELHEITAGAFVNQVVWAPDGRAIFTSQTTTAGGVLVRIPATGGPAASTGIMMRQPSAPFDVAPDGRIAFTDRTREGGRRLFAYEGLLTTVK